MPEAPSDKRPRRKRWAKSGAHRPRSGSAKGSPTPPAEALATPNDRPRSQRPHKSDSTRRPAQPLMAALDLGTNNCRLMIAQATGGHIKIIESFSRVVRLGEGLGHSGALHPVAMERAIKALKICAEKLARRDVVKIRAVATQACRIAKNGPDFIRRIRAETGLGLSIISPEEESRLAVLGCASLLQPEGHPKKFASAKVIDVGGGSTEISWVQLSERAPQDAPIPLENTQNIKLTKNFYPRPDYYYSMPIGVVNLAEAFPEPEDTPRHEWFESMVKHVETALSVAMPPDSFIESQIAGDMFIVGTSGAITSLAGVHLGLERYDRSQVDGLWLESQDCSLVTQKLLSQTREMREREPCIGRDRADLVLAGAAILEAVQRRWPCRDLRVADRGLREGLLISMLKNQKRRRRGHRR